MGKYFAINQNLLSEYIERVRTTRDESSSWVESFSDKRSFAIENLCFQVQHHGILTLTDEGAKLIRDAEIRIHVLVYDDVTIGVQRKNEGRYKAPSFVLSTAAVSANRVWPDGASPRRCLETVVAEADRILPLLAATLLGIQLSNIDESAGPSVR